MDQFPPLSPEVENLILDAFVGDRSSLATCALVSKRWLCESRRRLFTTYKVYLTPSPSTKQEKLTHELLKSDANDAFWPHIRELSISAGQLDPNEDDALYRRPVEMIFFNLTLDCISRSSHLRRLQISHLDFSLDFRVESFARLASTMKRLSSLHLSFVRFASPKNLLDFLESFRNPYFEAELASVEFLDDYWNEEPSHRLTTHPSLQWKIYVTTDDQISLMLKILLPHQWNITTLYLEAEPQSMDELQLLSKVVQQCGSALKNLYFEMGEFFEPDEPNPISLSENLSLSSVGLGLLVVYPSDDPIPSIFLTTLLESIQSGEHFQELQLRIEYNFDDGLVDWEPIESFDWKPVEDFLMDETKFPGNRATFFATFGGTVDKDEPKLLLEKNCLPRLNEAGRLRTKLTYHF